MTEKGQDTMTEKDNALKSTEQCQPCGISICAENYYSLCSAFRLCPSIIVFYTSLEVIKLAFLEYKSIYVCCIFPNFIFTFETKS